MNATELLAMYQRVADSPDAVEKLRRLVLDLALRGKLVVQNATDGSASELLMQIAVERARLERSKRVRASKTVAVSDEAPFELPGQWRWSSLAEVGVISPRNVADDGANASFVPMTLISSEYGVVNNHVVRPWRDIKSGYSHFAEGDVGLAKITPCFENGKSTVFQNLTGGLGSGTTELHVVRPILVLPRYVLLFLKSPYFVEGGIPKMTGTAGQKRVPLDYFAGAPFPLPPLAEQHRIVAKVDELMALCDQLEAARTEREAARDRLAAASLARLNAPDPDTFQSDAHFALNVLPALSARPDQIKQLRQTILNLAVRGKLVPQDPSDEAAEQLIRRVRALADAAGRPQRTHARELPRVDAGDGPYDLPVGWAWARFRDLGQFGRGRSKHRPRNDAALFVGGSHLVIQTGDVARSNGLITTHTSKYNDFGLQQSMLWPSGTLCITIAANIADSGILSFDACFPDSVVGFVPAKEFESARYFEYFVRTAKANLLEYAPATAQKNINMEILDSVMIPLPPLAEQHRIVVRVDQLMALCDQLEAALSHEESVRGGLLNALLHEALEPFLNVAA